MQSRLLNSRIESTLTLVVSALSVAVILAGTAGLVGRSFEPVVDTAAVAAPLERVVITSTRHAPAKLAQAAPAVAPL